MKVSHRLISTVLTTAALALVLAACSPATVTAQTTNRPQSTPVVTENTAEPTVTRTAYPQPTSEVATNTSVPTATLAPVDLSTCPETIEGTQLYIDEERGFCMLLPEGFTVHDNTHAVVFNGPESEWQGDKVPHGSIEVFDAQGKSAAESAAMDVMDLISHGYVYKHENLTVGGEAAIMADGLPAQDTMRKVFVVHADRLYVMMFTPSDAGYEHYDTVQSLYEALIGTFTFLR